MSSTQDESPEQLLCANCFVENAPDADFCRECGRPLSSMATIDPLRRAWSLGYWFRTAAAGPPRPIIFWGTWLILGSAALATLIIGLALLAQSRQGQPHGGDLVTAAIFLLVAGAQALLLSRMTARYMRAKRESGGTADGTDTDEHSPE